MSFRLKTILGIAGIEIILLSILVISGLHYLKASNEEQLLNRAETTARLFATMTSDAVVALDLATLDVLVQQTAENPGVDYVRVRHQNGTVLSEVGDEAVLAAPFIADKTIEDAASDSRLDVAASINVAGSKFGRVELGIGTGGLEATLLNARRWMLSVAGMEIFLVAIFGYILGRILTRQLFAIQKGARHVAEGNFGHVINAQGKDELADTAMSFNRMSASLALYANQLEDAKRQAEAGRDRAESILQDAVQSLSQGVLIIDEAGGIALQNSALGRLYPDAMSKVSKADDLGTFLNAISSLIDAPDTDNVDIKNVDYFAGPERWTSLLADGRRIMHTRRPMNGGGWVFVETDVTAIYEAQERSIELERELMQGQKMEALGTLAGGIAHEINTPIQYIGDNLKFLQESAADLLAVVDAHRELAAAAEAQGVLAGYVEKCRTAYDDKDVEFLRDEATDAAEQSIDGVRQVSNIVLAMKEFSHPASKEMGPVNLNRVMERSSVVCKSEWKQEAELVFDLDDGMPEITAEEGALNQIALNMIVNAAHAIHAKNDGIGRITVRTRRDGDIVRLEIEDTGTGIPEEIRERIFEPFFTTKDVGRGTGQGLALVHDIVVNKHGGRIEVDSTLGDGTTMIVILPIRRDTAAAA